MKYEPNDEDVRCLREWIKQVPYLPLMDDFVLAIYLRHAKGSTERAKLVYMNSMIKRPKYPELLKGIVPEAEDIKKFVENYVMAPLPKPAPDGSLVIVTSFKGSDPAKFVPTALFREMSIILRYYIFSDLVKEAKVCCIYITEDLALEHITKFTPGLVMSLADLTINALPLKLSGVHATNVPRYAEWLWNLAKSVLPAKIAKRFTIHQDIADLHSMFTKEILPADLGGDEEPLAVLQEKFQKTIEANRTRFSDYETAAAECELLLPGIEEDIVVGTFKQLKVD